MKAEIGRLTAERDQAVASNKQLEKELDAANRAIKELGRQYAECGRDNERLRAVIAEADRLLSEALEPPYNRPTLFFADAALKALRSGETFYGGPAIGSMSGASEAATKPSETGRPDDWCGAQFFAKKEWPND